MLSVGLYNLLLLEGVPEIYVFLRYVVTRTMLVHRRPGPRLYEAHPTSITVGSARICRSDDVVDSNIMKAAVAEPQGDGLHSRPCRPNGLLWFRGAIYPIANGLRIYLRYLN